MKGFQFVNRKEVLFQVVLHLLVMWFFTYDWRSQGPAWDKAWFFLGYALIAGVITYYLMPGFLYKKQYWKFLGGVLLLLAFSILMEERLLEPWIYPNSRRAANFPGVFVTLLGQLPVITILSGGKFAWDALQKQQEIDDLLINMKESELQFLRSQIHPHFLFNNLNNLYSYSLENSPKTPEIILELSGVLRYMLYESKERFVPLEKELRQLENFIRLYKLQIEQRGKVNFETRDIPPGFKIAPLILVVFIENAFKHSQAGQSSDIEIAISVRVHNATLSFSCRNNFMPSDQAPDEARGIGLNNVKKRLQLLYPQRHLLKISKEANSFVVKLDLVLERE